MVKPLYVPSGCDFTVPDEFFNLQGRHMESHVSVTMQVTSIPCGCLSKQLHLHTCSRIHNDKYSSNVWKCLDDAYILQVHLCTHAHVHTYTHRDNHINANTNSNLTTLVVPDCMSGKKAGLT